MTMELITEQRDNMTYFRDKLMKDRRKLEAESAEQHHVSF